MTDSLKEQLSQAMKTAMKAKDKPRLGTIRLIQSAIKQIEVDERIDLDDARVLSVMDKMLKQRRDSAQQYQNAGRTDLADTELAEIQIIQSFLPIALSDAEIATLVEQTINDCGATSMKDMGNVMAQLRPKLQGRADMGVVSGQIKHRLTP